jgi:NAD(P)-dependent dehydrogenase (short-subunit alcohol dehydrogenase family)
MKIDFSDKTILVTGSTRGIGKQVAEDLLALGARVLLTGTHADEIKSLNEDAEKKDLPKKYFCVDLSDNRSVDQFLSELQEEEHIHGLVNNAGINRLNYIDEVQTDDWNDMIAVNLSAPFKMIREISVKMKHQRYGRIVNVASIFSKISKERRSVYSATKFGLHGLTVGVSNDLARHGILVNTLSPGFVLTDLTRKNLNEEEREKISSQIPCQRLADVTDISNVALFLLSDLNKYLTGQNIIVDGGFTNI